MSINLVTICGHNTTMLRHMLQHYKDFVDEIYVVVYLSSDKDRVLSEVKEITKDLNIDNLHHSLTKFAYIAQTKIKELGLLYYNVFDEL